MPSSPELTPVPQPDRLIHEPARLAILVVLTNCVSADFVFLQRVTSLSKGNLSVQLAKLSEEGLVETDRQIIGKKTRTTVKLTPLGDQQMKNYWQTMDQLRSAYQSAPKNGVKARRVK